MQRTLVALSIGLLLALGAARPAWSASPLAYLCDSVACSPGNYIPVIKGVPKENVYSPGGFVVIFGDNFGTKPGQVRLTLAPPGNSPPLSKISTYLQISVWYDTAIAGVIPAGISGVKDQTASLEMIRKGGLTSKKAYVAFKAARKVIRLKKKHVLVKSCGNDGNFNRCNRRKLGDPVADMTGSKLPKVSIHGKHANVCGPNPDDKGVDVYVVPHTAPMKNGWVIVDYTFERFKSSGDWEDNVKNPVPDLKALNQLGKATGWQVQIGWSVTQCDWVGYEMDVFVEGPRGVSIGGLVHLDK